MENDPDDSVKQEIEQLIAQLTPEVATVIEEGSFYKLRLGYAAWLRNQLRQNAYPNVLRFCSASVPAEQRSLDAISGVALDLMRERLRRADHSGAAAGRARNP